jgi:uncharacterized protein (TIGR00661 family)
MTQALAVKQMLSRSGHELVGVAIGGNGTRGIPEYVAQGLGAPIVSLRSPGFVLHHGRSVNMAATLWRAIADHQLWRDNVARLRALVDRTGPDLIVNFFEPLTGLAQLRRPLPVPVVSVAHQHMIGHPAHREPFGATVDESTMRLYADLVGYRSWKLALSLYPADDRPERRVVIGPPLLRRELFAMRPVRGDYFLVYILNYGYHDEIRAWQHAHPDVALHCFYDRPGAPEEEQAGPNLTFHRLSGDKFLRYMAGCRAVVCTAGFESVSEAAWLDKPMLLIPVENHSEQQWNARDARQAGLALTTAHFDLDHLRCLPSRSENAWFRNWVARAESTLERVISAARAEGRPTLAA